MRKENLFDSMEGIADDYILEADRYQAVQRHTSLFTIVAIAAAVLLVSGGLMFAIRKLRNTDAAKSTPDSSMSEPSIENTDENGIGTATPTTLKPTPDPSKVIYAPNMHSSKAIDEMEGAFAGEIVMPSPLLEMIAKPENKDKYFPVRIQICRFDFVEAYHAEQESIYDAARNDPAILKFNEAFRVWLNDIYIPQFSKDEWAAIEKQDTSGEINLYEVFIEESWSKTNPDDVAAYRDAIDRLAKAEQAYAATYGDLYIKELFSQELRNEIENECHRLETLGYDVQIVIAPNTDILDQVNTDIYYGFAVIGYLSGEQLENFEINPTHGYKFTWLSEE